MKLLKTFFGNALVLATLLVAIAGTVLVAHAGRRAEAVAEVPGRAAKATEETAPETGGWPTIPRGSFIDAML